MNDVDVPCQNVRVRVNALLRPDIGHERSPNQSEFGYPAQREVGPRSLEFRTATGLLALCDT